MTGEMYAVFKTGGKQYRVVADDVIEIEKITGEAGETISFDEVLMIGGDGAPTVGSPMIEGATVSAEVVEQKRGKKIIVFKKKRRKNYRRKNGHRQELTKVKILEVLGKGQKASKKASKKAAPKAEAKAAASKGGKFELLKAPKGEGDDISLLSGVGPALEKKLHEYGIFHFWQVAGMKADDIAKMDTELKLGGRVEREEWLDQAQELMDGKAPRAKVDQKAAAKADKDDK
jgi:large subunit ribosomal protein L21